MCACDAFYECMKCRMGVWPYPKTGPCEWREEEQEAHERDISNPDFLKPFVEAS